MAMAGLLVKAVNKPTRPEMVPLRYVSMFQNFRKSSGELRTLVKYLTNRHKYKDVRFSKWVGS